MDLTVLITFTPAFLILGGLAATSWILEKLLGAAPVVGAIAGGLVKLISLFGFFIGIFMLTTLVSIWLNQSYDALTQVLLGLTGLSLALKPLKDVPWAAFVALLIGGACVGLLIMLYPLPDVVVGIPSSWIYLFAFLVPALLAFVMLKFAEDLLKLAAIILTFKPIATVLGFSCIVQGILLLVNSSLLMLFAA
jgi:hypothetical protein